MFTDLLTATAMRNQEFTPIFERALQRFRAVLPVDLGLALNIQLDHPRVRAQAQLLEELLFSVMVVTWQSMAGSAAQIVVEATELVLDAIVLGPNAEILQGGLPPQRCIRLLISDSRRTALCPLHGVLRSPVVADKRSTSARRLGVAQMHELVTQHKGTLNVSTQAALGTIFDICLPAAPSLDVPMVGVSGSQIKHVLYVDDYSAMRELASEYLPDAGFRVSCFEGGQDVLAFLQTGWFDCDAVVCDFRLVGMSGLDLLKKIKQLHPGLPVIIISGYLDEVLRSSALADGAALVVSKAADLGDLCQALRQVLSATQEPEVGSYSDWASL